MVAGGCIATVPRYDDRPPSLRLEVRGLPGGDLVLRPGSEPRGRELGAGDLVDLRVVAVDGGGVRRVALTGRITIGCRDPETGARTVETTDFDEEDLDPGDPAGVRTTAAVGRVVRVSDYRVSCADPGALPRVDGTFRGEAEDFHGNWSVTATFTVGFEPRSR